MNENEDIQNTTNIPPPDSTVSGSAVNLQRDNVPRVGKEPEETEEQKELREALEPYNRFPKLRRWVEFFTDKNNTKTYGNRTESVIQAGYDVKDRVSASQIGAQNFRKLKGLASIFAEDKQVTFEKLMETALARALTSENKAWWDDIMDLLGYKDLKPAIVVNNNTQNNTQFNLGSAEVKDWNAEFKKFLEQNT